MSIDSRIRRLIKNERFHWKHRVFNDLYVYKYGEPPVYGAVFVYSRWLEGLFVYCPHPPVWAPPLMKTVHQAVCTAGAVKTKTSKKIRQKKTARFFFLIFSTCIAPVLFYK
jgi:hypothetical protein